VVGWPGEKVEHAPLVLSPRKMTKNECWFVHGAGVAWTEKKTEPEGTTQPFNKFWKICNKT
jgi:hypothetical protein